MEDKHDIPEHFHHHLQVPTADFLHNGTCRFISEFLINHPGGSGYSQGFLSQGARTRIFGPTQYSHADSTLLSHGQLGYLDLGQLYFPKQCSITKAPDLAQGFWSCVVPCIYNYCSCLLLFCTGFLEDALFHIQRFFPAGFHSDRL